MPEQIDIKTIDTAKLGILCGEIATQIHKLSNDYQIIQSELKSRLPQDKPVEDKECQ